MKKSFLAIAIFAALAIAISSCKTKDETGLLIPKDAAVALHFNAASFSTKLSWQDIKATNWFQQLQNNSHDSLFRELMADPGKSGMDLKSDFVYFIKMRANGAYFVVDGKLRDDAAFSAYCKKIIPDASTTQEGAFSFISRNDKAAVIWNKDHFAFVINTPGMMWNRRFDNEGPSPEQKTVTADSLKIYGKKILSLSATERLGADKHFAALISEPGDIHFWMDMGKLYSGNNMMGQMLSMMKVSDFFEGNQYAATINFDNGKITMNGKNYQAEAFAKIWKKYPPQAIDPALVKRLPAENVMAAFAVNFQPEAIAELFKAVGVDGMANLLLGKRNLSLDDIIKANKGQMLFALTGFEEKKVLDTIPAGDNNKPIVITHEEKMPKFLFANAINNKGAFDRLFDLFKTNADNLKEMSPGIQYKAKDDWFAAGDSANVASFLSGKTNEIPFADRISGHPLGGYVDFQKIIDHLAEKSADSSRTMLLSISKKMWQDMVITSGDLKDGALLFSVEVNLVNKDVNSLKQLNKYLDEIGAVYKDHFAIKNKLEPVVEESK